MATTAAGAAGAAFLAACGGDESPPAGSTSPPTTAAATATAAPAPTQPPGLLAVAEDSSSRAKIGGTWQHFLNSDVQSLDQNSNTSGSAHAPYGYSRLFLYRPAVYPDLPIGEVDADSAEGAEVSPDGLHVTVRLKPDLKFDPRSPTNGRVMTAEDVKWSWEAFSATNSSRGELLHSLSPTAAYESLEILDERTVRFKLAFPVAAVLWQLAFQRYMWLMPREAGSEFDPKQEMYGNGPWRLLKWEPSVGFTYERNENWHFKQGQPYLSGMNITIISEYAQRRAQFTSGNLWTADIRAEDVLTVKREVPRLNLYPTEFPVTRRLLIGFGYLPDSPFHDVRLRRAVSMLLERDSWIDAFYNVSGFEREGLPVDARWDSHYMGGDAPFWIDPRPDDSKLGEGAAYFKYNPEEATRLVRAAGFSGKVTVPGFFNANFNETQVQAIQGMLNDSGLFDISLQSYPNQEWNQRFHHAEGKHEGIALSQSTGQSGDIDAHISVRYNVGNGTRVMFPEVFPWYQKTQDLIIAQRRELDDSRRAGLLEDLQKEMALQMPTVPWPGAASGFVLAWPHLANFGVFVPRSAQTPMTETWTRYWYDESKRA